MARFYVNHLWEFDTNSDGSEGEENLRYAMDSVCGAAEQYGGHTIRLVALDAPPKADPLTAQSAEVPETADEPVSRQEFEKLFKVAEANREAIWGLSCAISKLSDALTPVQEDEEGSDSSGMPAEQALADEEESCGGEQCSSEVAPELVLAE